MKKFFTIVILTIGFCNTSKAEEMGYEFSGLVSTSVWDKYLLFQVPVVVSDQPSLQSLLVINLPHGFNASIWSSEDLGGTSAGDEIDLNLGWAHKILGFNFNTGVGIWNVNPTASVWDDIVTAHVTFGKDFVVWDEVATSWYIQPRYYHTSNNFLGNGWNISTGINARFPVADKVSVDVNPFMSYDDGFGVTPGLYFGSNLTLNLELNDTTTLFFSTRALTGQGNSEIAGGVGISMKF
ncbi:MAG: hypothetical protein WC087_03010 [Candidatus Paceibacterota bacterium]